MARPPPPSPAAAAAAAASIDPRSGFCSRTSTFHSLRQVLTLPPETLPLSAASYALSLLPSPLPTHPAFISAATASSISYPHLLSYVRSLSISLRRLGLSNGHVAFILSPTALDVPVLYLALLSLGVVVSPANPASTAGEIAHQCRLSNPDIAFVVSSVADKIPDGVPTVILDSELFTSLRAGKSVANVGSRLEKRNSQQVLQSDPAAILYSSGTTGSVKGVVLTHRNLIAQISTFISPPPPSPPAVQFVTVPLFHVYGFIFCIKAIAISETAVLQTERFNAGTMLRYIGHFRVTHLTLAPPALLAMLNEFEDGGQCKYDITSLQVVAAGRAPVGVGLVRRFAMALPDVRLTQGYGLTESAAGVSRLIGVDESQRYGSVGRIAAGCEAKIVDPDSGDALLPGMQGEIWIRGPVIMKGYVGDQEATSLTLTSDGWLRTGDIGYIDNDGYLFFIDRLKELIKYKGYQVPPAELENLLQAHPDITEAAVIPYPNEEAGEVPMAFIVRQPESALNEAQAKEFVAKQVAPYKRIHRVSFVNSIPKNAAGKILRKELVKLATSKINSKL